MNSVDSVEKGKRKPRKNGTFNIREMRGSYRTLRSTYTTEYIMKVLLYEYIAVILLPSWGIVFCMLYVI